MRVERFARLLVSRDLRREIVSTFPSAVWERRLPPRVYRLGECPKEADLMDNTTLLIILILVLLLFGGGWYGRGRWY
jgi:hypothetical protein